MKQRTHGIYEKRSTDDLRTLSSKKKVRLAYMERYDSWFHEWESDALRSQIHKIEVELTARFYQARMDI